MQMQPLSKAKLKELAAYRHQKVCEEQGLFVVEGEKMAAEVLKMGVPVHTLCATAEWPLINSSFAPATRCWLVSEEQLARLSSLNQPNKVWMLIERTDVKSRATKCQLQTTPVTVVLDRIQDPGNLGTIIRVADWFGIRQVLCSSDTVSCFNPKVVRSTMGSLFRVDVEYCNLVDRLRTCGVPVYGAVLDGDDLRNVSVATPAMLVIGNESQGISPELSSLLTHRVTIPNIGGSCESLNAAVATALLVSKFVL